MRTWLAIDGSEGEGGGQLLRTALTLSLVTGRAFRMERIRAGRAKPGLLRQHLTAVQAAAQVGRARVTGEALGSQAITFEPQGVQAGSYEFAIGTAGSTTLVFQTLLPALLTAGAPSRVAIEGGTHNPLAPSGDFMELTFIPALRLMGASVDWRLERHGFHPAGGGRLVADVTPGPELKTLALLQRGTTTVRARAVLAHLPRTIAKRELGVVRQRLGLERDACRIDDVETSPGPGNVLAIEIEGDSITEVITGFGMKGLTAEKVAGDACIEAERYLQTDVPVGVHLADQLLVPMALAGGGSFRTLAPTAHTRSNADVIGKFLEVSIAMENESADVVLVTVAGRKQAS
jgi:RNA 3'-terminal phosphate cyclase (ATP)